MLQEKMPVSSFWRLGCYEYNLIFEAENHDCITALPMNHAARIHGLYCWPPLRMFLKQLYLSHTISIDRWQATEELTKTN